VTVRTASVLVELDHVTRRYGDVVALDDVSPPAAFPAWLHTLSLALPSRAARDLAVQVTTGTEGSALALPVLAYRRDEGRRFR
jgi:hypothetical protein